MEGMIRSAAFIRKCFISPFRTAVTWGSQGAPSAPGAGGGRAIAAVMLGYRGWRERDIEDASVSPHGTFDASCNRRAPRLLL